MSEELAREANGPETRAQGAQAPVGKIVYGDPNVRRTLVSRVIGRAQLVKNFRTPIFCEFVKSSDCAVTVFMQSRGQPAVGKFFARSELGASRLAAERRSYELFIDRPWRMPILEWRRRGFLVPRLKDEDRLDVASEAMTHDQRVQIGAWALNALLEIYLAGYYHGDLQPHNAWIVDGRPVVTDFESLTPRSRGVPFLQSADIIGFDPIPGPRPIYSAFGAHDKWSFHHVLGVTLEEATQVLRTDLAEKVGMDPFATQKLDALDGHAT